MPAIGNPIAQALLGGALGDQSPQQLQPVPVRGMSPRERIAAALLGFSSGIGNQGAGALLQELMGRGQQEADIERRRQEQNLALSLERQRERRGEVRAGMEKSERIAQRQEDKALEQQQFELNRSDKIAEQEARRRWEEDELGRRQKFESEQSEKDRTLRRELDSQRTEVDEVGRRQFAAEQRAASTEAMTIANQYAEGFDKLLADGTTPDQVESRFQLELDRRLLEGPARKAAQDFFDKSVGPKLHAIRRQKEAESRIKPIPATEPKPKPVRADAFDRPRGGGLM